MLNLKYWYAFHSMPFCVYAELQSWNMCVCFFSPCSVYPLRANFAFVSRYTLTGHFIGHICLVLGRTPFFLQNSLNSSFKKAMEMLLRDFGPCWLWSFCMLFHHTLKCKPPIPLHLSAAVLDWDLGTVQATGVNCHCHVRALDDAWFVGMHTPYLILW